MHFASRKSIVVGLLAFSACSGQVYHQNASLDTGNPEKGVKYYDRFMAKQYFQYTKHVSKDGKVDDVPCKVALAYTQISQMVDLGHPQIIYFKHGILENYKFDPHIASDGTLSEASAESSPDRFESFKNFTSGISSLASAVPKSALEQNTPLQIPNLSHNQDIVICNGNPILYTFEKINMDNIPVTFLPKP